jgi:hypothetical protein
MHLLLLLLYMLATVVYVNVSAKLKAIVRTTIKYIQRVTTTTYLVVSPSVCFVLGPGKPKHESRSLVIAFQCKSCGRPVYYLCVMVHSRQIMSNQTRIIIDLKIKIIIRIVTK